VIFITSKGHPTRQVAEHVKMLRRHWGFRKKLCIKFPLGEENPH